MTGSGRPVGMGGSTSSTRIEAHPGDERTEGTKSAMAAHLGEEMGLEKALRHDADLHHYVCRCATDASPMVLLLYSIVLPSVLS